MNYNFRIVWIHQPERTRRLRGVALPLPQWQPDFTRANKLPVKSGTT